MDERPESPSLQTDEQAREDFRSVLASVDRKGRRQWIYAAVVPGIWHRRRTLLSASLIAFYLTLPFLTLGGEPLLRFNLAEKHCIIGGRTFWPQDFFFILLAILAVVLLTMLLVSLFGRVFCGWLCPHSVFLEQVFRRIEAWCEGPAHKRRLADAKRPWPTALVLRKALKWMAWLAIAGALANTTTALFIGTDHFLCGILVDPNLHPAAAGFSLIFFVIILFNFAWFREQTCTIVCPYGRLQAALLDPDTIGVNYDRKRGEPRGKKSSVTGDCVDCNQCVAVCPTGIDIRNGNQMECIHCTACLDACDQVMVRLARPTGLIRYTSENALNGGPLKLLRPRGAIYAAALLAVLVLGLVRLSTRTDVLVTRLRDTSPPTLEPGAQNQEMVRRQVHLALLNRARTERRVTFSLPDTLGAEIFPPAVTVVLKPNERHEQTLIVRLPHEQFPHQEGATRSRITTSLAVDDGHGERTDVPLVLEAP